MDSMYNVGVMCSVDSLEEAGYGILMEHGNDA